MPLLDTSLSVINFLYTIKATSYKLKYLCEMEEVCHSYI